MKKIYFEITIDDQTDENVASNLIKETIDGCCLYVVSSSYSMIPPGICSCPVPEPTFAELETQSLKEKEADEARFKNYIRTLARADKIKAIKEVRIRYGGSLRESADFVNSLL